MTPGRVSSANVSQAEQGERPEPETPAEDETPKEWWDDPALPWKHKPTRSDIACFTAMMVVTVYGLVMMPLRPVLLTLSPYILASLGHRTGVVMLGANAAIHPNPWWAPMLVVASLSVMKFDWIWWWAGKLWGRALIEHQAEQSPRAKKRVERAERLTQRYDILAMGLTYLPIPIPAGVIYMALGISGTSLKKFLAVDFVFAALAQSFYMYLGYRIGEPAVRWLNEYGKYMWYLSIAILVGMFVTLWWRGQQKKAAG